jgi:glucose-1-phosphate thymidylyltransferase
VSRIRKAVVLAAGLGTRMRAVHNGSLDPAQARAADAGLKAMMPFGRPFLDFALDALADAGITDVCLVIGPAHDAIRGYYEQLPTDRLAISCAVQEEPHGTADAVRAARAFTGDSYFLAANADNLYPVEACRTLVEGGVAATAAFSRAGLLRDGQIAPERIAAFALIEAKDGRLIRVREKPGAAAVAEAGEDAYVSMNLWALPPAIHDAIDVLPPSPRNELELPLAVQALVDRGVPFTVFSFDAPVLDLSQRSDIAFVAARLRGRQVSL